MKRKLFLMVFAAVMALSLFSTAAFAADEDLTVQGGKPDTDYTYSDDTLTIKTDKPLTVSGSTTTDKIVIAENVKAKLTISDLSIDVTAGNAIDLENGASLDLTLEGSNTLNAGYGKAGIHVPKGTTLTIDGSGSLDVEGGRGQSGDNNPVGGAGIGADAGPDDAEEGVKDEGLGVITINSGTITAKATRDGSAGIGAGGWSGDTQDSSITITGGRVTASAAAGNEGGINAATIIISGGFVDIQDKPTDGSILGNAKMSNCCVFIEGDGQVYGNAQVTGPITVADGDSLMLNVGASLTFAGDDDKLAVESGATLTILSQFPEKMEVGKDVKIYVSASVTIPEEYKDQCTVFQESWLNHADTDWYVKEQTEFTLNTAEELAGLAKLALDYYEESDWEEFFLPGITIRLGNDIDLSDKAWVPFRFSGTFDGQGHEITGLTIDQDLMLESDWEIYNGDAGLFADLEDATVKDLTISGTIDTSFCDEIGGLSANASDSEISNVHSQVTIAAHDYDYEGSYYPKIGGLIGDADDVSIRDCSYQGEISCVDPSAYVDLGGLIGELDDDSLVLNCSSGGKIDYAVENEYEGYYMEGYNANIGGLVGEIDDTGRLYNSFSTMNISYAYEDKDEWSGGFIGGLVGDCDDEDVRLNTCWFGGTLPDEGFAYGIMGDLHEDDPDIVTNCWSDQIVGGADGYHGNKITTMEQLVKDLNQGAAALRSDGNNGVRPWLLDESGAIGFGELETILREPTALNPVFEVSNPDQVETYIWKERTEQEPDISSDPEDSWKQTSIDGETVWQSINHEHDNSSELNVSYDLSAGDTITFSWKVDCEEYYDYLSYSFKDPAGQSVARGHISGETDWKTVTLTVPGSGKYTLSFTYYKDNTDEYETADCGYVKLQDTYTGWGEISLSDTYYLTADQAAANAGKQLRCVAVYKDGQRLTSAAFEAAPLHTVTFDSNGGSDLSPAYVGNGGHVLEPAAPTRAGYTFTGWYSDADLTEAWDFDVDIVSGDMTLYAGWRVNSTPSPSHPTPGITVEDPAHGTVTVDPQKPGYGDEVTITPQPDEGFVVDKVTVTDRNGDAVEVTAGEDGSYHFTQPWGKVTIEVTFTEEAETPATDVSEIFADIAPDAWYTDAVQYAYDNGLMTGTAEDTFAPNATTTRGMIVAILHRLEGEPAAQDAGFSDVADGSWYASAVAWAKETGIVNGYSDSTFGPNDAITREQMAAILMNYAEYKGQDITASADLSGYADADDISAWAEDALAWANAEGLINGMSDDELAPQGNATRAQVAAIFQRFLAE